MGLVMIASAIELSFISATVGYLAQLGNITFTVVSNGQTIQVPGLPANLSVNQGHTSNGAAGTGLIVIGFAGTLALWLRSRTGYRHKSFGGLFSRCWYRLWLLLNVPALLLTLTALAYVFAVTNQHKGQSIDLGIAKSLDSGSKYPLLEWTPQGWFGALSKLDFVVGSDQDGVQSHLDIARGWQYNLIPFFVVQFVQTVLALMNAKQRSNADRQYVHGGMEKGVTYGGK